MKCLVPIKNIRKRSNDSNSSLRSELRESKVTISWIRRA